MRLSLELEAYFPNLHPDNYRVTSHPTLTYNCIAHAVDRDDAWWWPVAGIDGVAWPDGVQRECTLECFAAAFATEGYVRCERPNFEEGFEKVAVYVDAMGEPTHAARQLSSGAWTSKLGESEDIEHKTLADLEDQAGQGIYGTVAMILKRARRQP